MEDYTSKYKGEQVEVALMNGDYQDGVLTASLHCSSRCDAPEPDWPPRGLAEDAGDDEG